MDNIIRNIGDIHYIKNEIVDKKVKLYNEYIRLDINNYELLEKLRWYFMFINHCHTDELEYRGEANTLIYSSSLYSHDEVIYKINSHLIKLDLMNISAGIRNLVVNTSFIQRIEEYYDIIRNNIDKIVVVSSYNVVVIDIRDKDYDKFKNSYEYEICTKFFRSRFISR